MCTGFLFEFYMDLEIIPTDPKANLLIGFQHNTHKKNII